MTEIQKQARLEAEALVVGYAMSRLNGLYRVARGGLGWNAAFQEAAEALEVPPASIKNLRDEFDPAFDNGRKGWHDRPMRPSRQRVLDELASVEDDELMEMVRRILGRDPAVLEAIDALAPVTGRPANVAERLLTGRRAEEFFLAHCTRLGLTPERLIDRRLDACGYDFGDDSAPSRAYEVKGLKPLTGQVQFTDREWQEARSRRADYHLIVVGGLSTSEPILQAFADPWATLPAQEATHSSITTVWQASVSVKP